MIIDAKKEILIDAQKEMEKLISAIDNSGDNYRLDSDPPSPDPVIEQLVAELRRRSEYGLKKYGVPLSREDLTLLDWLKLALEETLDKAGYLQCAINKLEMK